MINYQMWNTFVCLGGGPFKMDCLRNPYMIAHHIVAAALAFLGLHPFLHSFAPFFFGMVESTSVPLTIFDVIERFSESSNLTWTSLPIYQVSRISFALSFILLRLILWPIYCAPFWKGSIDLMSKKEAHSNLVVDFYLISSLFMTFLQLMWGQRVVTGLMLILN